MQFLLSVPSNEPPKPATPKVAVSTLAPQPTSTNVAAKPSPSVATVSPALAAKRKQLEEKKVAELKEECRRLNLGVSGSKSILVDRLLPFADDILSSSSSTATSEGKPLEQFVTSVASANTAPALGISSNDASSATNIMFNMQQPPRMITTESSMSSAATISCNTSAVPMDVDGVSCKEEPKTPDVAQPNVYPMLLQPASSSGNIVQASVSSAVQPLIVIRLPESVPQPIASLPPLLQQEILMKQRHHISELERSLQQSQQELAEAQREAQLQRILRSSGDLSMWMNNAALNGSSMSASSASSAHPRAATPQLQRTNR